MIIDYLAQNMWQVWAVLAVLGLVLELSSGDFFIMCFAIGACGAAVASPFVGFYWQLAAFIVITALSIWWVRPFALRYLHKNEKAVLSNADALIGRQGHVTETIVAQGFGRVAIDGDRWKAVAADDSEIEVGTRVRVIGRESTIITVTKD